jgi:hypothetical protein
MDEKQFIEETEKHIKHVKNYLHFASKILLRKGRNHDKSKLYEPEKSIFMEYTEKLKNTTFGSDEYKQNLSGMKPALEHHYMNNPHHPERFKNGIAGMNLMDLTEMFFDWMAATKRHVDGDIDKSIEINKNRFGYDDILEQIFKNTVIFINDNWNFEVIESLFNDSDSDNVRNIVYDWITGIGADEYKSEQEYKSRYTKRDYDAAYSIVMTLISMGLG